LIAQYKALLETDGVYLTVTPDAIDEIASQAMNFNQHTEDIGARRLHTVLERVFQDIAFDAPDAARGEVTVDREYVKARLESLAQNQDLSRFIL
jgi:ATP-dependent HslUV protease ATP-binding subunit HslU